MLNYGDYEDEDFLINYYPVKRGPKIRKPTTRNSRKKSITNSSKNCDYDNANSKADFGHFRSDEYDQSLSHNDTKEINMENSTKKIKALYDFSHHANNHEYDKYEEES